MAIASSTNLPDLIDEDWQQQSSESRLQALQRLPANTQSGQQALDFIAHNDNDEQVRCVAIGMLNSLPALLQLQSAPTAIAAAATQQYYRILAGTIETEVSEAERLAIIRSLPLSAVKQIALLAKCKAAGTEAVSRIMAAEELADLSLYAASVHVRKEATLKIDDIHLLSEIQEKIRDKDKTVAKLIEKRLEAVEAVDAETIDTPTNSSAPVVSEPVETQTLPAESRLTESESAVAAPPRPAKPRRAPTPEKLPDPASELPRLEQILGKLTYKHTEALNGTRNSLNKIRKAAAAASPELESLAASLHERLTEKLEKNRVHQEQLQSATTALLTELQQALDTGQSHDALPTWDKIQGNINNTSGKIRAALQKLANVHKAKLNELRDWKAFAATEKKKELLTQMQHLIDSKMHAADRSKHISKLHQEWKTLGRSNQNEQLWREFKQLSDKAYEPCKEYFKQRKQLMVTNFAKRREICDLLEAELARMTPDKEAGSNSETSGITDINKMLQQAEREWKAHAPIEQSKIKALQKRYFAAVNQLRKIRKHSLRDNGAQKQAFIDQALALAESEDRANAMREAKRLQQEWKQIGPTSFKDDKKYWEDFRAACDKIFEKRPEDKPARREKPQSTDSNLHELLQALEAIHALEGAAFREAKPRYLELAQQFAMAQNSRVGQQAKRLQEQFNGLKRKIDARYRSLPDKKHVQLKQVVQARAALLETLEQQLLQSNDTAIYLTIRDSFDRAAWDALPVSSDARYDQALEERLRDVLKSHSAESLNAAATLCAEKARALCIELEIRANIDSPEADQRLRMQVQLDQLKNGFGKQKPNAKENTQFALDAEIQSYCMGPVSPELKRNLLPRIETAVKKLL